MLLDGKSPDYLEGNGMLSCTFKSVPLLPQDYSVKLSIRAASITEMIIGYQDVAYFTVAADLADYGFSGPYETYTRHSTSVMVPYEWQLPNGSRTAVSLNRESPVAIGWER
jgi:hypothetical protein